MTETIRTSEEEKQADNAAWKLKEAEILKKFEEDGTRAKQEYYYQGVENATRNGPQLTPEDQRMSPNLGHGHGEETVSDNARGKAAQWVVKYLNDEREKFFEELEKARRDEIKQAEELKAAQAQQAAKVAEIGKVYAQMQDSIAKTNPAEEKSPETGQHYPKRGEIIQDAPLRETARVRNKEDRDYSSLNETHAHLAGEPGQTEGTQHYPKRGQIIQDEPVKRAVEAADEPAKKDIEKDYKEQARQIFERQEQGQTGGYKRGL